MIEWFKIEIIYPKTVNLSGDELDSDESWRVPKDDDIYATEIGYFNLGERTAGVRVVMPMALPGSYVRNG